MVKIEDNHLRDNIGYVKELGNWTKKIIEKVQKLEIEKKKERKIDDDKVPMFSKETRDKILNREDRQEMEIK